MPIITQNSTTITGATTTAQRVIDGTSQDFRSMLQASGTDANILLDYLNRIHLELLRASRWEFLSSPRQRFITQMGVTDYWVGPLGQGPTTAYDTQLNLTDVEYIREGSVFDRTNQKALQRVIYTPVDYEFPDALPRYNRPADWRSDRQSQNIIGIYPAPDNQNTYQPVPLTPGLSTVAGGSLPARTYYVVVTLVDSIGGESVPSLKEGQVFVPSNRLLVVNTPQLAIGNAANGVLYTSFKVYVGTTTGGETLQATSSIITNWTEPGSGLVNGVAPPTVNTVQALGGYVLEFTYFRQRAQITSFAQILQVPDDYYDVLVAGVNYLTAAYLRMTQEAGQWHGMFTNGIRELVNDKNQFPKGESFLKPDAECNNLGYFEYGR